MKQCSGEGGKPNFEKMKEFMESCGKMQFSEDEVATMKGMCGGEVMPDFCRAVRVHGSDDGHRPFLRNLRRTNGETRLLRVVSVR